MAGEAKPAHRQQAGSYKNLTPPKIWFSQKLGLSQNFALTKIRAAA